MSILSFIFMFWNSTRSLLPSQMLFRSFLANRSFLNCHLPQSRHQAHIANILRSSALRHHNTPTFTASYIALPTIETPQHHPP